MEDFMPIEPMEDQEPSRQSIIKAKKKNFIEMFIY